MIENGASTTLPKDSIRWKTEFWISAAIIALDQITKAIISAGLPVHGSAPIIRGFIDLTHVQNTGAAFGLLNAVEFPFKTSILAIVAALALVGIAMYSARLAPHQKIARLALALVLGGAVGNLIDRLRHGYVIDFVDVYWGEHHFWAFNVADSAITVGVVLMMLDMLLQERNVSEAV